MEMKEFKTQYPKETMEVGEALAETLNATAKALEDGWQPGTDIPAIVIAPIGKLGQALDGMKNIPEEFSVKPVLATMGIVGPVADAGQNLIDSLRGKQEVATA